MMKSDDDQSTGKGRELTRRVETAEALSKQIDVPSRPTH